MSKRQAVEPALSSWSEVDESLARLCQLEAERRKVEARLNQLIESARSNYAPQLDEFAREEAALRAEVAQFAAAHRDEFAAKKSVERLHGVLSFRTSPPAVKLLPKWTNDRARDAVEERLPWAIREVPHLDKDAVLAAHARGDVLDDELRAVGLRVVQSETFGIELKYEEAPAFAEASAGKPAMSLAGKPGGLHEK